jgi:hypothetical protein
MNRTELMHDCGEYFGKQIPRGWVDSLLAHHAAELFETKYVPQEKPLLEAAVEESRKYVYHSWAELVVNRGEIGMSELADRVERKVIFSATMRGQTLFHGVNRNLKHIWVST